MCDPNEGDIAPGYEIAWGSHYTFFSSEYFCYLIQKMENKKVTIPRLFNRQNINDYEKYQSNCKYGSMQKCQTIVSTNKNCKQVKINWQSIKHMWPLVIGKPFNHFFIKIKFRLYVC